MEYKPVLNRREVKRQKTAKTIKGAAARIVIMTAALLIVCFAVMGINRLTDYIRAKNYRALSDEEIAYALVRGEEKEAENADASSEKRLELARAACSIVGKVNYFWGGKSAAEGIDPAWGELREVTSSGSESSGQMKPYGLDCSGFVSWAFIQLGYDFGEMETLLGNGTWNQWDRSADIAYNDIRVGDVAFMNRYPTDQGNHIGICIGFLENGEPVFAHCSSSYDNVVVTTRGTAFNYARRLNIFN